MFFCCLFMFFCSLFEFFCSLFEFFCSLFVFFRRSKFRVSLLLNLTSRCQRRRRGDVLLLCRTQHHRRGGVLLLCRSQHRLCRDTHFLHNFELSLPFCLLTLL